jgi:PAS domain S-box-containing protein
MEKLMMPKEPSQNELQDRIHELEREITLRKADQERLQRIVSSLDVALSVIGPDKTIAWVNDKILQMFPNGDPVGHICHRFYESSDEPCENCPADRSFATGDVVRVERYNPAFKRWFDIVSKPIRDTSGEIIHVLCTVTDITERKRAEETLQESEERFRFLAENMFDVVWIAGLDLRTTYVSPSVMRLLGLTPEERNRQTIEETVTPESLRKIQKTLVEELQRDREPGTDLNRSVLIDLEYYRKDGSTVCMENRVQAIRDAEMNITGLFGVSRDITERRNDRMDLERRSRERRMLLDTIPVQVWYLKDPDTYGALNFAHADFYGRHPRDLAHKRLEEITTPEAAAVCREGNIRVFETGRAVHTEEWVPNAAGEKRLIAVTKTPRLDDRGNVEYVVCAGVDITEQRRTEMALRESEVRLRNIFDLSPVGIELYDRDGRMILANPACIEIFGVDAMEELISFRLFEDPNLDEVFKQKLRRGEAVRYEVDFDFDKVRGAGLYRTRKVGIIHLHVIITPIKQEGEDKPTGYLVLVSDITERVMKDAQLRESEERYRMLCEDMPAFVSLTEPDGAILFANRLLAAMVGKTPEEIVGKNFYDFVPPEDRRDLRMRIGSLTREHPLECHQQRYPAPDGAEVWREWTNRALFDSEGRLVRLQAIGKDVTEQKRREEEIRQLQKAESLGRMAGAIAHHFNNQLQAVVGNLELAVGDLPKESAAGLSVKEAMNAALRAARVSGQMLTYLGQTVGRRETLDLSEVCSLILPMIEAVMPKPVTLKTELSSPGPVVLVNANQVEQVLTNLLTNASEAMPESGGTIDLTVTTVDATDIALSQRFPVDWRPEGDAYACIEVRDTGPGIAEGDIEKLFDPFFTTKFTGRGLGLPVALGIVRAHGGCITVESRVGGRMSDAGGQRSEGWGQGSEVGGQRAEVGGQRSEVRGRRTENLCVLASLRENPVGSVFRVLLPLTEGEVSRPKKMPMAAVDAPQGGGTVLLVEDTEQVRNLGVRMLQLLGFTVLAAKDGVEGVEIFREHRDAIRLVLSDLTMPRMDGWKTIAALRKIDPNIPIILASGYDEASVMSGDHSERPQVFLGKPYSLEELGAAIGKVMEPQIDTNRHRFNKQSNDH